MDRAALAITQILLRNRTIEERKQKNEDEFVRNLLNGRDFEQDGLQNYMPSTSRNMYFRVIIIQMNAIETNFRKEEWEWEIKSQQSMMIRALFKRNGFFPAVAVSKNEIVIIASFIAAPPIITETGRFSQVVEHIVNMKDKYFH